MKNTVKASIIIPCFNTAETIGRSLRAFSAQAVPSEEFEIIVVDDCSTDTTAAEIHKVQKTNQIFFLQNEINSGPALTRNRAIDQATGEVLIFVDGDTIPCEGFVQMHLESHLRYAEQNQVVVGAAAMPEDLEITPLMYLGNVVETMEAHEHLDNDPYGWLGFSTLNVSIKRDFVGDSRFDDGSFKRQSEGDIEVAGMEDVEFAQRLARKGIKLVHNPKIRAFHYHFRTPDSYITKVQEYGKRFAIWMTFCDPNDVPELQKRLNYLLDREHPLSKSNLFEILRRLLVNDLSFPLIRQAGRFFENKNEKLSLFFYQKLYKYLFLKGYNSK